jgi:hypothetical protein
MSRGPLADLHPLRTVHPHAKEVHPSTCFARRAAFGLEDDVVAAASPPTLARGSVRGLVPRNQCEAFSGADRVFKRRELSLVFIMKLVQQLEHGSVSVGKCHLAGTRHDDPTPAMNSPVAKSKTTSSCL